jgi:chemotaxis protein MotB
MAVKKREEVGGKVGEWVITYGDMVTLMLCFFVALFDVTDVDVQQMTQMISSMNNIGIGSSTGGFTLSEGKMAELGNTVATLPSTEKGRFLGTAKKKAISLLQPEIGSNKVRVSMEERGVVISIASDVLFRPASAEIDIEASRELLMKLADLLKSPEVAGRTFRLEGHTDSTPVDPEGRWASNWELSAARAINVLSYLVDFGVEERRFQVAGFSDTQPLPFTIPEDTEEKRAANRRVDLVIIDDAHL